LPRQRRRPRRYIIALLSAVAVTAGLVAGVPSPAAASTWHAPATPPQKSVPVTPVATHYQRPKPMPSLKPAAPSWPSGTATVSLTAPPASASSTANSAQIGAPRPVQAGSLPIWIAPVTTQATTPDTSTHKNADNNAAGSSTASPSTLRVSVTPRATATKAGITGVVVDVHNPQATATTNARSSGSVAVTLQYKAFASAFGGDWASRLRAVTLPTCVLTTPNRPDCHTATPVPFTEDRTAESLTATVGFAAAAKNANSSDTVLAVTSAPSGSGGDYSATSLKPSGSWTAGGSSDGFSWSYPIPAPSVPGGLAPKVALSYDSQSVNGLISSTNNQASWIGDGWDYSPGYVERSYQSCEQNTAPLPKTGDTCWSANNTLTLSLNGQSSTLIQGSDGSYHPQGDPHERVQYETGAINGAQSGEYFVVTTDDGTQYYFGLNQLPGWTDSSDATTNSVWTEPVYSPVAGQPCYNASFAKSVCTQAYRWDLDYVKDTHNDVISYFYNTEINYYDADSAPTTASYIRGGYLARIQYGQRDGEVYSSQPAAQVIFTSTGRCDLSTCDPSTLSSSNTSDWPDVPYDLNCAAGAACQSTGASFWSEYALQTIQTQALVGTTETNVDSWTLSHTFPATGDGLTAALWLSSIQHAGQDTTAGGSSDPIQLPAVNFDGESKPNRVDIGHGLLPITRERLTQVTTETGETITVNYTAPDCGSGTSTDPLRLPSDPSQNGSLCYPSYWTPPGPNETPTQDWFNQYLVYSVTESDGVGGANGSGGSADDEIDTIYTPIGTPAWHHDDNPLTPSDQRTWNDWRGYTGMDVSTGTAPDPVTKTHYTYFRGMDGDTLTGGGSRPASVTDSRNDPPITDLAQYEGMTYETIVYNGDDVVSDTIADPWTSAATASQTISGLPTEQAFMTGTADTRVYTTNADGSTRETQTSSTYDTDGRVTQVNDQGDLSTTADDLCTTNTYVDNSTLWIYNKTSEVKTTSGDCSTKPTAADVVSDDFTYYDGSTPSAITAPSKGDVTTSTTTISATDGTTASTTSTYDEYGRPLIVTNPDTYPTTTTYTPATGATATTVTVKDSLGYLTTTVSDPLRGLPVKTTDTAGYVTTEQYDALGRLTAVYKPGVADTALKYTYTVSNTGPSVVDTYALNYDGSYRVSETLYDAMLRARETQTQTLDNGRNITDVIYNTDGWETVTNDPYWNSGPVSPTYVEATSDQVPSETEYSYDSAGRKLTATAVAAAVQTWQTTYAYTGNSTTTIPPAGGTPSTTLTDARGNTTDLLQYHSGVPADPTDPASDYSDTHYTYTPAKKLASITDAAGNSWSYQYDLLGDQTVATDPDAGRTTNTYDAAGLLLTTADARGKQTTMTYDKDGRKTDTYDTTGGAAPSTSNMTAAWTYDKSNNKATGKSALGYPTAAISYSDGDVYTHTINEYTGQANVSFTTDTLTGEDAALLPKNGISVVDGYTGTGYSTGYTTPAVDGLPNEGVKQDDNVFGEPAALSSAMSRYVTSTGYSELGQPEEYDLWAGTGSTGGVGGIDVDFKYDQQTQAVTDVVTTDSAQTSEVDHIHYTYGDATVSPGTGLLTSTTDSQNGGPVDGGSTDTQCFGYDDVQHLSQAWTATDSCAAIPQPNSSASVGGPAPYWQSWTYDAAGDRATETDHDTTGNTKNDTTTTYHYPATGSATDQPHTLSSTNSTGPQTAQNTASYVYNADGNTTSINTGSGGSGNQTLTYNDQDQLTSDVTAAGNTTYVYDASGNLLLRRDPGQTTLFVASEQLTLNTATGATSGTRYYSMGSRPIAARTGSFDVVYLIPDRQGTDQLTISPDTFAVTRRQYEPFGQARGIQPITWPGGDSGYVGGTPDPATSLENLGAREYDPATGRFLTLDPQLEPDDPTQLGGYDYAGNDPITRDDPTGLKPADCGPSDGCLTGYENANRDLDKATDGFTKPGSPQAKKAVADQAIYDEQQWVKGHSPDTDNEQQLGQQLLTYAGKTDGNYWDAPVGDGGHLTSACFGRKGCEKAYAYLMDHPTDIAGAKIIAATYCIFNIRECTFEQKGDIAATTWALMAVGGLDIEGLGDGALCMGNSFIGNTRVLMADGSEQTIGQVKVGDKIANSSPGNSRTQVDTVAEIHVTYSDHDYDQLTVATPGGPETVTSTAEHLYWNVATSNWAKADNLNIGDRLDTPGEGSVIVIATRHYTARQATYNLTISHTHTYYVIVGTVPVLVHNASKCDLGDAQLKGDEPDSAQRLQADPEYAGGKLFGFDGTDEADFIDSNNKRYDAVGGPQAWARGNMSQMVNSIYAHLYQKVGFDYTVLNLSGASSEQISTVFESIDKWAADPKLIPQNALFIVGDDY
jgi:RHS repeat-associated protein